MAKGSKEFENTPVVNRHIQMASRAVGTYAAEQFTDAMGQHIFSEFDERHALLSFDSPLETAFWIWWMAFRDVDRFCQRDLELHRHRRVSVEGMNFILDFVIEPSDDFRQKCHGGWPLIAIEVDGHTFHEKTTEQVEHRNKRDRALQRVGWQLFHFSFSEFNTRPEESVLEVLEFARDAYGRLPVV